MLSIQMAKKRLREYREKMTYVAFFLPKSDVKRINRLLEVKECFLETKSDIIRHCIKEKLKELEEKFLKSRSGSS